MNILQITINKYNVRPILIHMHSNPVKEVSRVKKQKQKTYERLEMCHLEPLALLGATVVMVVGDGLVASVVVVHVVL